MGLLDVHHLWNDSGSFGSMDGHWAAEDSHYVVSGIASYAGHAGKRMTMMKEVNLSFPRAYVCHTWYLVVRYLLKKQYV